MKTTKFKGNYYGVIKCLGGGLRLIPLSGTERIKTWAHDIINNKIPEITYHTQIKFVRADKKVFCIQERPLNGRHDKHGYYGLATCNSMEPFDYEIGKAISFCRLFGITIPDFVFEE